MRTGDGEQPIERDYPDISGILSAKAQRRRALAALPWEEKIAIVEQMRALLPKGAWKERSADVRSAAADGGLGSHSPSDTAVGDLTARSAKET